MASKKQRYAQRTVNPIETASNPGRDYSGSEISKTARAVEDQITGIEDDFISQLLGFEKAQNETSSDVFGGEMQAGVEITLSNREKTEKSASHRRQYERRPDILGGIDYRSEVLHGGERLSRREASELDNSIQEIMAELKRLVSTSAILRTEFAGISVEQRPNQAGKYYINFFEWLLIEIRKLRTRVEDAGVWLVTMKSKKSQRKYGAMAKKHGTSFTLSNERTAATQTG